MKFLFINHSWTPESFLEEIERRMGYALERGPIAAPPDGAFRDHVGVHAQRQPGLSYAGFSIVSGRVTTDQLRTVARLAEHYGNGALRLTASQNVIVLNVPRDRTAALEREAAEAGLSLSGSPFQRGTLSCTGSEYCKLAITETKQFSIALARELEHRLPRFSESLRVHVTGCPNACGQHWIADVGLQGVLVQRDGAAVEGFDVFVGGGVGSRAAFARRVGYRAPAGEIPDALERLFHAFQSDRAPDENFQRWSGRAGDARVRAALAGDAGG